MYPNLENRSIYFYNNITSSSNYLYLQYEGPYADSLSVVDQQKDVSLFLDETGEPAAQ